MIAISDKLYADFEGEKDRYREILQLAVKYRVNDFSSVSIATNDLFDRMKEHDAEWIDKIGQMDWDSPRTRAANKEFKKTVQELRQAIHGALAAREYTLQLYQSVIDPWEFILQVQVGKTFPLLGRPPFSQFTWSVQEGDKFLQEFDVFFRRFREVIPPSVKYKGNALPLKRALRLLYHAIHHPEQYVKEILTDELDRLLETYGEWGEKKEE